jgi:hypothetical protein
LGIKFGDMPALNSPSRPRAQRQRFKQLSTDPPDLLRIFYAEDTLLSLRILHLAAVFVPGINIIQVMMAQVGLDEF